MNMNYGHYEIIEGIVHYYQKTFNMSKIVAKFSEHNEILKKTDHNEDNYQCQQVVFVKY